MILTLTINPAIDRNVTTDRLVFEDRGYILETRETAGGRGINAACVIQSFGGRTLALATAGGAGGERLTYFLDKCGIPFEAVPIRNDIRTNLTISDRQGLTIKLNEAGPRIESDELERIESKVRERLEGASWLMLCGSAPPGVPEDFYARLIKLAHQKKVAVLLDTDGEALRAGIRAKPAVVTPNQAEAERLLDTALLTHSHFYDAVKKIHALGAQSVVLSLGERGAVALEGGRVFEAIPPRIEAVCPIGAGDALAAAFTWARQEGESFQNAVKWGVAAGTATAKLPGVRFASLEDTRKVYAEVEVRRAG